MILVEYRLLGAFLKGKDNINTVLLFLSGEPGIPDYFLAGEIDTGLEGIFTVCYWNYYETALSYSSDCKANAYTTDQFVQDVIAVTEYVTRSNQKMVQKEYYVQLKTPLKGFYTFEHSAHSPLFEEP
ncbi:hypothetical protein Ami103574_14805 [Aminipila butyrica]|uniref:Uncharacterized protein n=1 Tax=Aminipila butyrica TaxID=433296 RepID=A0A858BX13_9FIRM|nr:hypothetical protein [Aminipila butyrica]QIB70483.1 hypothetical protein Ami103574_14805 [Aminipila butyrica]